MEWLWCRDMGQAPSDMAIDDVYHGLKRLFDIVKYWYLVGLASSAAVRTNQSPAYAVATVSFTSPTKLYPAVKGVEVQGQCPVKCSA